MSNIINSYRFGGAAFDFGNALEFDGVDDYVSIDGNVAVNSFAFSYWFKYVGTAGVPFGFTGNNFYLGLVSFSLQIKFRYTNTIIFNFATNSIPELQWHHVYLELKDNNEARCFVDGVESVDGIQTGLVGHSPNLIGKRDSSSHFKGDLDEAIFRTGTPPVNAQQTATDLYNNGDGVKSDTIITNPDWYLKLNESGTDTTATDSSGNGNDGTLNNFDFVESPWVDHFTGVPTTVNANVASHTYTYHGSDTDAFLDLFIATADQVTTGRTIDLSGNTISPYALAIITDLANNYQVNVIT